MQKNSYSYDELIDCGKGNLFGKGNAKLPLPPMLMFDRITEINQNSGEFKKGFIKAELDIKDNLWFHLDYEEIIHRVIKASSFKLIWILDPFMNVGAVGVVAKKRGRRFIGFESNQDQILLAMKTINEREN